MQHVKLYTASGGFVVAGWVPPFLAGLEAEVLIWGERVFKLRRDRNANTAADDGGSLIYDEAFAVALVQVDGGPAA